MNNLDKKISSGINKKIIAFSIIGAVAFAATTAFAINAAEDAASAPSAVSSTRVPTDIKPISSPTPIAPIDTVNQSPAVSSQTPAPTNTSAVKKCGVNTYSVSNECGIGAFKNMYFQCYDGYEEKQGGESSCKSSEVWQKYAREGCANRCSVAGKPAPIPAEPSTEPVPAPFPTVTPVPLAKPIAVCYIPDKLTKDYNQFLLDLRKAESDGDKEAAEVIIKKITALKLEIERTRKECLANTAEPRQIQRPAQAIPPPAPVAIDRCVEVGQWENKIAYYEKLAAMNDADLKEQTGFSREEVEKILVDLPNGLVKIRAQCQTQSNTAAVKSMAVGQTSIAEPIKPVVVESGREISDYYKAKIEKITSQDTAEAQIQNLQSLKSEIDELIGKLIRGRKEVEISEFNNVVSEIKVSRGEIKADDVAIKTTDKKILINVGGSSVSVAPTSRRVLIQDKNLEVTASAVSIKDNALMVGNSEVKLAASEVAEKLNISPTAVELKEENAKAVYKIKVAEPRKLFGFISIKLDKTLTTDADNGDVLKDTLPWYAFLTTK